MTIPTLTASVPWLITEQMIEVDRAMIEDYRIDLVRMMENAGRCLAIVARERFLGDSPAGKRIVVLAGTGGNGGGALVAARRLHNWGAKCEVVLAREPERMTLVPRHQLGILENMGVKILAPEPGSPDAGLPADFSAELLIDGLIGYSLKGPPRSRARELILWANGQSAPTLALDAPSGIDTTSGVAFDPAIRAAATVTLALPKEGLRSTAALPFVGDVYLADISVPPELYARPNIGLDVGPIFAASDVVKL